MSIRSIFKSTAQMLLPKPVYEYLRGQLRSSDYYPPVGYVRFGDLRRVNPVSKSLALRGLAVDRYYIEKFLELNADHIHGRVMEIKDNHYTLKFGKERVTQSDILNYMEGINPESTIIADLASAPHIPSDTFDCIIFTQTLQLIYDIGSGNSLPDIKARRSAPDNHSRYQPHPRISIGYALVLEFYLNGGRKIL